MYIHIYIYIYVCIPMMVAAPAGRPVLVGDDDAGARHVLAALDVAPHILTLVKVAGVKGNGCA